LVRAHVWHFGRIAAGNGRVHGALVGVERSSRRYWISFMFVERDVQ
jgi:hypothetical protein